MRSRGEKASVAEWESEKGEIEGRIELKAIRRGRNELRREKVIVQTDSFEKVKVKRIGSRPFYFQRHKKIRSNDKERIGLRKRAKRSKGGRKKQL